MNKAIAFYDSGITERGEPVLFPILNGPEVFTADGMKTSLLCGCGVVGCKHLRDFIAGARFAFKPEA